MTAASRSPGPGAARRRRRLLALAALAALFGVAVEAMSDARHIAAIAALSGVVLLLAMAWLADVRGPRAEIAERTEAEHELAQARTTIEDLIAVNPAMVFAGSVADSQLRITFVSQHANQLLGYAAPEMVGGVDRWLAMIHPDDAAALAAANQATYAVRGPAMTSELRFRHADGAWRWLLLNTHFEYGPDGNPTSFVGNAVDISDRKETEEALAAAKAEAERASRAKSEFLSVMSHELRTPLNAILGFGQLLEMSKLSDPDADSVARILRAGRNLLGLVDQVLEFSRIEAGRLSLSIEPVALHEVVREALDLARPLAEERDVAIEDTVATEDGPVVLADRRRLAQVLLNLLSNGVQYNRPGGSVTISAEPAGERVRIAVSDTGIGIPEDVLPRLFQPFESMTAGGPAEAAGLRGGWLGLAYSKRLVEAMAGTLTVESRMGVGSTFTIELPRAAGAAAEPGDETDGTVEHAGRVILYIEDNLANLELVEHVLRRRPGVRVLAAMQGRLGLELAREHGPDLVLLDLHLPDVAPDETIRALKADERTRDIPVIVLSSENLPRQAAEMRSLGARDYLTKPLDVAGFLEAIDTAFAEIETR